MKKSHTIHFSKMHALGNDFMLIDARFQPVDPALLPVSEWADRHTGIGFDQLLLLLPSDKATVACRIFNLDGSEAEQCGNGMRCVARYLYDSGHLTQNQLTIETLGGRVEATFHDQNRIEVNLGVPCLQPGWREIVVPASPDTFKVFCLSVGNPHAILQVDSLKDFPVELAGKQISTHEKFPGGVNVGFVELLNQSTIHLATFERGSGVTLSCGSNACAATVMGICHLGLVSPVNVQLPKGNLEIFWKGEGSSVSLVGSATKVFEGTMAVSQIRSG